MDPTRIVQRMDSDDDEADLESLRLAALRSRNQKKVGDVGFLCNTCKSSNSLTKLKSIDIWCLFCLRV